LNAKSHSPSDSAGAHRPERANWAPGLALGATGVRPSKGKGQNFLVQPAIADRIVAAASLARGDTVVEIGPGLGILSERIVAAPIARLYLVELDARLADDLKRRLQSIEKVEVINADFLDLDLQGLTDSHPLKVIGNLPFNAASAILRRLCESRATISAMVLMFQREVAERIRARLGDAAYSMLSAITRLYWEIGGHFRVGAGNFHPKPKVDAEVLAIRPLAAAPFASGEEHLVLATIRAAFSSRRKMIRNALAGALGCDNAQAALALAQADIASDARAETLDVADFVRLARALKPILNAAD
jgi:16S rRNA (adenine1518-N6/adenine1519-N6)-dimethyltransferase